MLSKAAKILVLFVAFVHIAIAVTEIFLWEVPAVHSRLRFDAAEAHQVAPIVANAGLYNGFLAAGLIWGLLSGARSHATLQFFLICVIVAGIFGAITISLIPLLLQTIPGGLALLAVWLSRNSAESPARLGEGCT